MSIRMQHIRLIALLLLHLLYDSIKACPNDLFLTCSSEGTVCKTPLDVIIAYGYDTTWAYTQKTGGVDINCDDATFGDPISSATKECCKLTYDLAGTSGLSPVVNIISCGETIQDFFVEGVAYPAHYWRFDLSSTSIVTVSNCITNYDTKMNIWDFSGEKLSETLTGCDGDDCGCATDSKNEEIVDLLLSTGYYYVEVSPFSIYGGVYYLSLECKATVDPTAIPTPSPTVSPKRHCGTTSASEDWWCYDVDVYPLIGTETSHTVAIANDDDDKITYFSIYFTIHDNHCIHPSIMFLFEETDFSLTNEYINIYDADSSDLAQCRGTEDQCGNWIECFSTPEPLGVDKIKTGETYRIFLEESATVDSWCANHPYSINAQLTLICSAETASPTKLPTREPTTSPTFHPTNTPSNNPTSFPSQSPITSTTSTPTDNPTADPTNAPTVPPSVSTHNPTERPTPSPVKIIANHPTPPPTAGFAGVGDDDNDDDDDGNSNNSSKGNASGSDIDRSREMFFVILTSCIVLFAICCTLIICVYYQRKQKRKQHERESRSYRASHSMNIEMGHTVLNSSSNVAEDENALIRLPPSGSLVPPQAVAGVDSDDNASVIKGDHARYESLASDMGVIGSLTPMGDVLTPNGDIVPATIPELPSERVSGVGEDEMDGEDDYDDMYAVPHKKNTVGDQNDDVSDDDDDNALYGKAEQSTTVGGPVNENDVDIVEAEDDEDDDEDENDILYAKPNKEKTSGGPGNDEIDLDVDEEEDEDNDEDDLLYVKPDKAKTFGGPGSIQEKDPSGI